MTSDSVPPQRLTVGLIAHDSKKQAMVEWVGRWLGTLAPHEFIATGTTGGELLAAHPGLSLRRLRSGPLGGDQQMGALIAEEKIDALVFFIDPMTAMPHDVDVKALIRLAALYDVPVACNPATADCIATCLGAFMPRAARRSG